MTRYLYVTLAILGLAAGVLIGLLLPQSPVSLTKKGFDASDLRGSISRFNPAAGAEVEYGTPQSALNALGIAYQAKLLKDNDYTPGGLLPRAVVIHNSDSPAASGCDPLYNYFLRDDVQASSHFCVDAWGTVYQFVPTGSIAWHAGNLNQYNQAIPVLVEIDTNRWWLNQYVWGIELALDYSPTPEYLEDYPLMQESLAALVKWLATQGGIPLDRFHIITHHDIDSVNRVDPLCCWKRSGLAVGAQAYDTWVATLDTPPMISSPDEEPFELIWLRDVDMAIIQAVLTRDYYHIRQILDYLQLGLEP